MKISIQGSGSSNYLKAEHTNEEKKKVVIDGSKLFGDEPLDEDLKGLIIDALS